MKTSPGLLFLSSLLVLMVATLVGGQVWALTGLVPLGLGTGLIAAGLLGAGVRLLLRRLTPGRRRFFGEYQGAVEEGDFSDVAQVVSEAGPRGKIRHGVEERPDRVAGSVRSLLVDGVERKRKNR
jgi:hypothetical protein